jgi:hypothetical protein
MMTLSQDLAEKSVAASLSAIEIYNKPDFKYREETFAILMTNAWELLLKAKVIKDNGDALAAITDMSSGAPKLNRSGNPMTYGIVYLLDKLHHDKGSGLTKQCYDNILLLIEVRDNAIHFINKDLYFSRRILDLGTASLRNYLSLVNNWFAIDLSRYNFFLMPLSFYHGFEAAESLSVSAYNDQMKNFLRYLAAVEKEAASVEGAAHAVTLCLETKFVRSKEAGALPVQWTNDPDAPVLAVKEEDALKGYPYNYRSLTAALKDRYTDFVAGRKYHSIRKPLEKQPKYCKVRLLDPGNSKSGKKNFYSSEIFKEFDKHYTKKK